jgi:hypothetical protein
MLRATTNEKEKVTMGITERKFYAGFIMGGLLIGYASCIYAMEVPNIIELDTLSNIYTAVTFDHTMHVDMASCATCHHHTTGMQTEDLRCLRCHEASGQADELACSGCHANTVNVSQAANLFHSDPTGLKRAYHLQCLGCHKEMEAASGCEDCHTKEDRSQKVSQTSDKLKIIYSR